MRPFRVARDDDRTTTAATVRNTVYVPTAAAEGDRGAAAHVYRHGVASGGFHSAFNLGVLHYENDEFEQARATFAEARRRGDLTRSPFDADPQPGGARDT